MTEPTAKSETDDLGREERVTTDVPVLQQYALASKAMREQLERAKIPREGVDDTAEFIGSSLRTYKTHITEDTDGTRFGYLTHTLVFEGFTDPVAVINALTDGDEFGHDIKDISVEYGFDTRNMEIYPPDTAPHEAGEMTIHLTCIWHGHHALTASRYRDPEPWEYTYDGRYADEIEDIREQFTQRPTDD